MSGKSNARLAVLLTGVVGSMIGVSFAAVPLYRLFCAATGFAGTPVIGGAAGPGAASARITVRFNADTNQGLPWKFAPLQRQVTVPLGSQQLAAYEATNEADTPVTGVATYNVTPEVAGRYFHKTACFCFNEQILQPGQRADFPIAFWVDPAILQDPDTAEVRSITLSYTFFRALDDKAIAAAGPHVGAPKPGG